jgi:mannosyltransferase OCH1-like enzyme
MNITIPTHISPYKPDYYPQKIPKMIIQIYHSNDIHPFIHANLMKILEKNSEYDYWLITMDEGEEMIKMNFDDKTYRAYKRLNLLPAKADFIRYVALYLYGGVYLDIDSSIECKLRDFIPASKEFVFFYDFNKNLVQWCFMTAPKNDLILAIIKEMVKRISMGERNIFLATGPTLFTDVIYNYMHNTNEYNTYFNVPPQLRHNSFVQYRDFMNGLLLDEMVHKKEFLERMNGYKTHMIYSGENKKYEIVFCAPTPGFYK